MSLSTTHQDDPGHHGARMPGSMATAQRVSQLGLDVVPSRCWTTATLKRNCWTTTTSPPFRSVCAGGPGRTTPKASPAMPARLREQRRVQGAEGTAPPPASRPSWPRWCRDVFEDAYNYMKKRSPDAPGDQQAERESTSTAPLTATNSTTSTSRSWPTCRRGERGRILHPARSDPVHRGHGRPRSWAKTVLDPACGTGGFLVCAIEHVRKQYVKSAAQETKLQERHRGIEKKPMPHLLCTTNMILHEIEVPSNIRHDNALVRPCATTAPRIAWT